MMLKLLTFVCLVSSSFGQCYGYNYMAQYYYGYYRESEIQAYYHYVPTAIYGYGQYMNEIISYKNGMQRKLLQVPEQTDSDETSGDVIEDDPFVTNDMSPKMATNSSMIQAIGFVDILIVLVIALVFVA